MNEISLKDRLLSITQELAGVIRQTGERITVSSDETVGDWLEICSACERRLDDDLLKMAVVGTIKSGKSTFINALFGGDYLKRGAGVITSIVTRAQQSDRLRAVLVFKSWQEINAEIHQALQIFPSSQWRSSQEKFDLRTAKDREELEQALKSLESKHLLSKDTRNIHSVLLDAYLKGYPEVENIVTDRTETIHYEEDRFAEHKEFAGSEYLAVYLKDIRLKIPGSHLEKNIEIADCQGSDSPNPLHLVMIQDYLRTADLVVYLISSRTGLRQADIKFLTMIKNMVGMSHVLFVVNCDFNEHESISDLHRVSSKIRDDLSLIVDKPGIYVFSALYNLFSFQRESLPERERMRLEQWEADKEIVQMSGNEERRFEDDFRNLITEHRYNLMLENQIQRMSMLIADIQHWLELNRSILSSDAESAAVLLKKIKQQQKKTEKIRAMIKSTLDGASQQQKRELKVDADRFFDIRHGAVIPGVIDFVKNYTVSYEQYADRMSEDGFAETLYLVFQTFKQDLDRYMAERVNPTLFRFIKEKEDEIREHFESITRPYDIMVAETLSGNGIANVSRPILSTEPETIELETVKQAGEISIPSASATLAYTTSLKTEAFMKLGYFRFVNTLKKAFRRSGKPENAQLPALKSGVSRMKRETESSLVFHFKNYRENIKFQYLFKLIDSVSEEMHARLVNRFNTYKTDLAKLKAVADQNQDEKSRSQETIEGLNRQLTDLGTRIVELKSQVRHD